MSVRKSLHTRQSKKNVFRDWDTDSRLCLLLQVLPVRLHVSAIWREQCCLGQAVQEYLIFILIIPVGFWRWSIYFSRSDGKKCSFAHGEPNGSLCCRGDHETTTELILKLWRGFNQQTTACRLTACVQIRISSRTHPTEPVSPLDNCWWNQGFLCSLTCSLRCYTVCSAASAQSSQSYLLSAELHTIEVTGTLSGTHALVRAQRKSITPEIRTVWVNQLINKRHLSGITENLAGTNGVLPHQQTRDGLREAEGIVGHSSIVSEANFPTLKKKSHMIFQRLSLIFPGKLNNTFPTVMAALCSNHVFNKGRAGNWPTNHVRLIVTQSKILQIRPSRHLF